LTEFSGTVVFVAGPSGAGKDSLIRYAARRLAGDQRFVFPRRMITRRPERTEDHDELSPDQFRRAVADGQLALYWQAHGLSYGIPIGIEADLAAGRTVAVNVSRNVLARAIERYRRHFVTLIDAPPAVLAQRLAERGREPGSDIDKRVERKTAPLPEGARITIIRNDASLEAAGDAFVTLLRKTRE
jgi:phosphonate metabolism protein PhnN/1,5-bisphosphokinase (PRPP-forming)